MPYITLSFLFPNNLVCIAEKEARYLSLHHEESPDRKIVREAWLAAVARKDFFFYLCTFWILFWGSVQQDVAFAGDI